MGVVKAEITVMRWRKKVGDTSIPPTMPFGTFGFPKVRLRPSSFRKYTSVLRPYEIRRREKVALGSEGAGGFCPFHFRRNKFFEKICFCQKGKATPQDSRSPLFSKIYFYPLTTARLSAILNLYELTALRKRTAAVC